MILFVWLKQGSNWEFFHMEIQNLVQTSDVIFQYLELLYNLLGSGDVACWS